jgi:hypothetical protein
MGDNRIGMKDNLVRTITGIMVSHNGYTSPMLVDRIADAVLSLPSQDRGSA